MTEQDKKAIAALNTISYGLYVISSKMDGRVNAQCGNSLFQITTAPRRVAVGINKSNYTFEFIRSSGVLCLNVLRQNQIPYVKHFGLQTGRKVDKFATVKYEARATGSPVLPDALAYGLPGRLAELRRLRYAHDIRLRPGRGRRAEPGRAADV